MPENAVKTDSPVAQFSWLLTTAERCSHWIAALILADYLVVGFVKAKSRTLWLDEIMGTLIARLPATSQIWDICKTGADNQPAFYHLLTRASMSLFGSDALGLRAPSVVGFAVCSFCLYWFVSRRVSALYGLVAMLFPALTLAWMYGTEGRPYAMLLACAGLGAVCWQAVNRRRQPALMTLGLALSLLLALNLHYYASLMFLPFWLAEVARTFHRKTIDLPVWLALTTPLCTLLVYLPVLKVSRINSGLPFAPFASPELFGAMWRYTVEFLAPCLVFLVFLGALYLAVRTFTRVAPAPDLVVLPHADRAQLIPEACLVLAFTALPFVTMVFSKFATHLFFSRYAITGIFGFSALIGLSAGLACWNRKGPGFCLFLAAGLLVLYHQVHEDIPPIRFSRNIPQTISVPHYLPQAALDDTLPIVPTNLDDYMQFFYYTRNNPKLHNRFYYVSSEQFAEQYLGFTFHERMMLGSAPYFHTQVVDYNTFVRQHPRFYVFGSLRFSEWFIPKLMAGKATLQIVQAGPRDIHGGFFDECLLATMPAQ